MSVRCNTNSAGGGGVSCPQAAEQAGHRVTQHIPCLRPLTLEKIRSPKKVLKDLMWKSLQSKTFSGLKHSPSLDAEFYTHKIQETLTVTRCALYLTDYLTCIKQATVISTDGSYGESLLNVLPLRRLLKVGPFHQFAALLFCIEGPEMEWCC